MRFWALNRLDGARVQKTTNGGCILFVPVRSCFEAAVSITWGIWRGLSCSSLISMLSCTIKITNGLLEKCFCFSSVFCCPECRDQAAATSHQINCDLNLSAIRSPISHWLIIPLIKLNKIPICFWLIEYLIKKIIGDVNDVNRLLIGWLFPHTIHSKY